MRHVCDFPASLRAMPLVAMILTTGIAVSCFPKGPSRGVRPLTESVPPSDETPDTPASFDPRQSAGLFVGVRDFQEHEGGDRLSPVDYAVDDAVDLAHLFALELRLVEPIQVQLLLSGEPEKPASRDRLELLIAQGAKRAGANRSDVLFHLDHQSRSVGPQGLLIVTFATHGIRQDGGDHLLAFDSIQPFLKTTALDFNTVFDVVSRAETSRKIVLIDTCREVVKADLRGTSRDPSFSMSQELAQAIARSHGEVILTAARAGGYAYPDPKRKNGVFTVAILDTLSCQVPSGSNGLVTVADLARSVNQQVTEWVKRHKPGIPGVPLGIEYRLGGTGSEMALTRCTSKIPVLRDPCHGAQLDFVEIYLGSRDVRRIMPPQSVIVLEADTLGSLQNLTGKAFLSYDRESVPGCSCRWEQFDPQSERWTEMKQIGGCSFSMPPPRRQTSLRLTLGDRTLPPILLNVQ